LFVCGGCGRAPAAKNPTQPNLVRVLNYNNFRKMQDVDNITDSEIESIDNASVLIKKFFDNDDAIVNQFQLSTSENDQKTTTSNSKSDQSSSKATISESDLIQSSTDVLKKQLIALLAGGDTHLANDALNDAEKCFNCCAQLLKKSDKRIVNNLPDSIQTLALKKHLYIARKIHGKESTKAKLANELLESYQFSKVEIQKEPLNLNVVASKSPLGKCVCVYCLY
jgi:hypothetical protein